MVYLKIILISRCDYFCTESLTLFQFILTNSFIIILSWSLIMHKHCLAFKSVTMEHQSIEEEKTKISRSTARHLRRKKLIAARREAEDNNKSVCNSEEKKSCIVQHKFVAKSSVTTSEINKISASKLHSNSDLCENIADIISKAKDVSDSLKVHSELTNNDLIKRIETKITTNPCEQRHSNIIDFNDTSTPSSTTYSPTSANFNTLKLEMGDQEKTREQIKAEREAKKLAKAKAKGKIKDKVKGESLVQLNKIEEVKVQEKLATNNTSEDIKKIVKDATEPAKQTITQNIITQDKTNVQEQNQPEEQKTEKSKAELRAERRAKQEAQRAAKQASLNEKKKPMKSTAEKAERKAAVVAKSAAVAAAESPVKKGAAKIESKENLHEVNLFKHLYINKNNISQLLNRSNVNIHPAIIRLGVQYADKVIVGSNARCVALLAAVRQLIEDFERPLQADFTRGLETCLLQAKNYLDFCRPSSVSMENALKHLQMQMTTLPSTIPDKEAKSKLTNAIDTYIQEQIHLADKAISQAIQKKIVNGDVILTYGFSSLIHKILCDAYDAKKQFRVIVVDGRPWLEGKELLRRLVKHGIDCSYMLVNALSFIMPQVNKVFLGAHAILANGAVMSRVGTAQVALMANAFNVPVLVACETHKSCERVQTDSIVFNEIGNPDDLIKNTFCNSKKSCLLNWKNRKTLNLLNITYDVTPADLVTAVVTELAILPCTSVPVILRIKPSKIEKN